MSRAPIKPPRLIISVKEARKLLGMNAATLTDDQVEQFIITLTDIASVSLQKYGSKNIMGTKDVQPVQKNQRN